LQVLAGRQYSFWADQAANLKEQGVEGSKEDEAEGTQE